MSYQVTQSPEREGMDMAQAGLQRSPETDGNQRKNSEDHTLNRACEACRLSKVRCLASPDPACAQCQRCAKAGRACVFMPPVKRRQRKRTDVRVAELEKEVMRMRNLMNNSGHVLPPRSDPCSDSDEDETKDDATSEGKRESTRKTSTVPSTVPKSSTDIGKTTPLRVFEPRDPLRSEERDIVERCVIDLETADDLLNIWRNTLTYACPGVVINNDWTASELRERKPLLFHAVMAAASHSQGSALSDALREEAVYLFARSTFVNGLKSIESIQGLLVLVAYYSPPKTLGQIQIYSWVNMAASMALELGLASKPRTHEQLPKRAIRSLQRISSPDELLEHCRTVLYLYVVCAGFSMRLRRPNILLFNSWMEECIGILEKSKLLDDKRTLAWLKLQRIADDANTACGFDDASTSFSLSELRMQLILRTFERRMEDWRKSTPEEVLTLSLKIEYHQNILSMWEFAMDGGRYDSTDFRNRHLTLPALDDNGVQPESLVSRSAIQLNAVVKCLSEAHAILDTFLDVSLTTFQRLPNIIFVRATYALVAILKADYAVETDELLGEVLESKSLKVDEYLSAVIAKCHGGIGIQQCRIPRHWHDVLTTRLQSWYDKYLEWKSAPASKRRKAVGDNIDTGNPRTSTSPLPPSSTFEYQPIIPPQTQNYVPPNPYAWTNDMSMPPPNPAAGMSAPPFALDSNDLFQNGDLYLWNDIGEGFGNWMTQGGMYQYGDDGFGTVGATGF